MGAASVAWPQISTLFNFKPGNILKGMRQQAFTGQGSTRSNLMLRVYYSVLNPSHRLDERHILYR
jgi:hypothetical protein